MKYPILLLLSLFGAAATPLAPRSPHALSAKAATGPIGSEPSGPAALQALVARRLPPTLQGRFTFVTANVSEYGNDAYTAVAKGGKITITSATTPGLSRGLLAYLRSLGGDMFWSGHTFTDDLAACIKDAKVTGGAWAQIRHLFNMVTYSYSMAFYDWDKLEYLLDWAALHGYNLPLAPGGQEYIVAEMLGDFGLSEEVILNFTTGPAFHSWSRRSNIRASWAATTTLDWLDKQWALQTCIVSPMVALGMTPILPGFTGMVPAELHAIIGGPPFQQTPRWNNFPDEYSRNSRIDPTSSTWAVVQKAFLAKQRELYGGWTSGYYNTDLFTEMAPVSTNPGYLRNLSNNVMESLNASEPSAVWVMNGWFMANDSAHWTPKAVKAFLSPISPNATVILDLASESLPQYIRVSNFFGHRWIWNTLINYGQNNGMYGRLQMWCNAIIGAKNNGDNMVGQGLTMEGINNNENVFELATDQAWSSAPIDLPAWTRDWVLRRYALGAAQDSAEAATQAAWLLLDNSVYADCGGTDDPVQCTTHSIFDVVPNVTGITNVTGHYLATKITYNTLDVVAALDHLLAAADARASLAKQPAFRYDLVDVARQALFDAGINLYLRLMAAWRAGDEPSITGNGTQIVDLLHDIDRVLATDRNFQLSTWVNDARAFGADVPAQDSLEFQARNQITVWGPVPAPTGWELDQYAAKQWAGVVGDVFGSTWDMFYKHCRKSGRSYGAWTDKMLAFEGNWNGLHLNATGPVPETGDAVGTVKAARAKWDAILTERVY
ncbi:hypothetical protein CspeluHIS016_0211790 [Cutaneotrichosporon spelunceum]|uniref:Alpha-N-acetylglucosaminidase n=1 Tax=Cutaneotrichosporon spelunceum TaxID=1672016 RepID=A0AAD3YBI0_9TREE|nr:hypothetical protein CspeluHIS016_0211790 [Cutaneotrichosporon spelunceum]